MAGYHKIVESFPNVPRQFTRREGDWSQEGGNNTLIVLGTDRAKDGPATIHDGLGTLDADGKGRKTGSALVVVGRRDRDGNPDHSADDAFLYLSMRTEVDRNLRTQFETDDTGPAAVLKADHVRLAFRKNLKVSSSEKATHAYLDGDRMHVNLQDRARVDLDVRGAESSVKIDAQGNFIEIRSDGTVRIQSTSKVTVDAPSLSIEGPGNTTIRGTLTVQGMTRLNAALNVQGPTTAAAIAAASISAGTGAGGNGTPGRSRFNGDVEVTGQVKGRTITDGRVDLAKHYHTDTRGDTSGPALP